MKFLWPQLSRQPLPLGDDVAPPLTESSRRFFVKTINLIDVVQRGATDGGAADEDGLSSRHGLNSAGTSAGGTMSSSWVTPVRAVN